MPDDTLETTRVTVFYDPLCGWCYGAAPALRRLLTHPEFRLELVPAGLFAGPGARPMDAHFAAHAWSADQRISQLTGQPFSERYRDQVLADRLTRLDSGPATLTLTAVALASAAYEFPALEAIQAARYVDGRDVTDPAVLADIIRGLGLGQVAARVAAPDAALVAAARARVSTARREMQVLGATGVPTLVVGGRVIASDVLYGRLADISTRLTSSPQPFAETTP